MLSHGVEIVDFSMRDERNFDSDYADYFVDPVSYHQGSFMSRLRAARSFVHSGEAVKKIIALAQETKPDIAHMHNIYHQLTPSIIPALKKLGVKVVMTLHDGKLACPAYLMLSRGKPCLDCNGSRFYLPLARNCQCSRLQGALLTAEAYYHKWKKSYDGVDLFITPSRFLADVVAPRIGQDRLEVLSNGIDMGQYVPSWEDENYILYLGRLSAEKGVSTLIKAHAAMEAANAPRLVIVGTGPLENELRELASPNVTFTGYCSGAPLREYIRKASCLVIPSECYENCPMSSIEAMAMGKPIIGARMGGIPEQVEDGVNGFLFEAGNIPELAFALDKIMASLELRRSMGKASRIKAETEYSLDKHNSRLMHIYTSLLS